MLRYWYKVTFRGEVMYDLFLLFGVAISGGVIAILGLLAIIGKKITEPRKELIMKIETLEREVNTLKMKKD
jgi:hypothetical protein